MRALTLLQPWPCCFVDHGKRIENRTWRIPPGPIALHGGKGRDRQALRTFFPDLPEYDLRPIEGVFALCVIAPAIHVPDGMGIAEWIIKHDHDQWLWTFGPWAHPVGALQVLGEPVPCKGALGCWTVPADVEARVLAQVPA